MDESVANKTTIYKAATDDENDPLLNPAHLLIGTHAPQIAQTFTDWALGPNGQKVITDFQKFGRQLYTAAPDKKTINVKSMENNRPPLIVNYGKEEWTKVVKPGL